MRKIIPTYGSYKRKESQIRKHFLWFPKVINGEKRWLETSAYYQRVEAAHNNIQGLHYYWNNYCWVDEKKYNDKDKPTEEDNEYLSTWRKVRTSEETELFRKWHNE